MADDETTRRLNPRNDEAVLASFRDLMAQLEEFDALIVRPDTPPDIGVAWSLIRMTMGFAIGTAYGAGCVLVSGRGAPAPEGGDHG